MSGPTDKADIVAMARAAFRDERLSTGALYAALADEIERLRAINVNLVNSHNTLNQDGARLEDEIGRLRTINAELVAALKAISTLDQDSLPTLSDWEMHNVARAALAKARDES